MIGLGFGNAGSNSAHADFRYQLDRDGGRRIGIFQIMDKLGQIFNGINVVVRRGRNQAHTGDGETQLGDIFRHLAAGQLPTLTGLRALRHFDLNLIGVAQIFRRDAETSRGYLLDA